MNDALAYFLTIRTYGTWLPGDDRGWNGYHTDRQAPHPKFEHHATTLMPEPAKLLTLQQRLLVELQIRETCTHRGWICHAVNCRTNHMHAVITALDTPPKKVRADLKAWCARRLKEDALPDKVDKWWASRGSIRVVFDSDGLMEVVRYTLEEQDGCR